MPYSHTNLCNTVESRARYETARCTVGHAIQPWQNGGRSWAMHHKWTDHKGGYEGGTCQNCGKTLKECKVLVNPKKRNGGLAREIALMPRDVPPVRFITRHQG